jgi:serine/threonine protein phosphatase PrpC
MTEIGKNTARHGIELPRGGTVEIAWAAASDTGRRRQHNEDSFVAQPPLFAVADGMGGHSAGDLASAAVVTRLSEADLGDFGTPEVIGDALHLATLDIAEVADEASLGVGTTVTGAMLSLDGDEPSWIVFNVGDSRVYVFDNDRLVQVTVDHSVVQEMVDAGMIAAADAESHPDSNIITRAVGFNADPIPDYWQLPVRTGMRVLLCSDGLTKEVAADGIADVLATIGQPDDAVSKLVSLALEAGGRDNVTALVVDVLAAPEPRGDDDAVDADTVDDGTVDDDTTPTAVVDDEAIR